MRRAGTPPSTFLFLPIHLSNSSGPVPRPRLRQSPEPPKPAHPTEPDAVHRAYSEGLRRRAIAPKRRRAQNAYIIFAALQCQHLGGQNRGNRPRRWSNLARFFAPPAHQSVEAQPRPFMASATAAPHCGHIPPTFFANVSGMSQCGGAAASGDLWLCGLVALTRPGRAEHCAAPPIRAACVRPPNGPGNLLPVLLPNSAPQRAAH